MAAQNMGRVRGVIYTPHLDEHDNLSWTNDGDLPNPESVNIRGLQGEQGKPGKHGERGETGPQGDPGTNTWSLASESGYDGTESEFYDTLAHVELARRKVREITEESTNTTYPSAAAVLKLYREIVGSAIPPVVKQYNIDLDVDPEGGGTASGGGTFYEGTSVTVTATPNSGYTFVEWRENGRSRLPSGYTEVEYIQSSGEQYIDTEYYANKKSRFTLDFQLLDFFAFCVVFGTKPDSNTLCVASFATENRLKGEWFGGQSVNITTSDDIKSRQTIDLNKNVLTAFGQSQSFNDDGQNETISAPMFIFTSSLAGNSASKCTAMKLFSCKIYDNDVLVRDFVPCKNPSGAVGLYDIVSGAFYGNSGSGTFEAGTEINSGVTVSQNQSYTFTVNSDRTLTAVFAVEVPAVKRITVKATDNNLAALLVAGTLTVAGTVITATETTVETTDNDVTVSFEIKSKLGNARTVTVNGQDIGHAQDVGEKVSTTLTATDGMTITVAFSVYTAPVPTYTISATVDPPGSGSVTGAGQYKEGESVNLKATANDGYDFVAWKESGATVHGGAEYTFVAEKNRDLVAAFEEKVTVRLPSEYQEVAYVDFDGKTRISGAVMTNFAYYGYELDAELLPESSPGTFIGIYGRSSAVGTNYYFNFNLVGYDGENIYTSAYKTAKTSSSKPTPGQSALPAQSGRMKIAYDLSGRTFSVNDATATYTAATLSTEAARTPIQIGCTASVVTSTTYINYMAFRFYGLKTFDSDKSLYNDLVPCRRISDGVVGLYDIAQAKFYAPNAGTLTAGTNV